MEMINSQWAQYGPQFNSNTVSPQYEQKEKSNTFQNAGQHKHVSSVRKLI
jgi:hypothetical protein